MASSPPAQLDFKNIQADILTGFPKKTETYYFFQINNTRLNDFRKQLSNLVPLITTVEKARNDRKKISGSKGLVKISGINVVFSKKGLTLLGTTDNTGDASFEAGMKADAEALGDKGTTKDGKFDPDWLPAFKNDIHGMVLVSGDTHATVNENLNMIENIFSVGTPDATITQVLRLVGDVRPGAESGHEHFGFLDGVSQPAVAGVDTTPFPGQDTIRQGIILVGREGDAKIASRPSWALDGSFLAFRYLPQLVPEFNQFLDAFPVPGVLPPSKGSEFRGARLVGRWKSGAPIDVAVTADDPQLGADPTRNDDFFYSFPEDIDGQDRCPFAAHTRKTNPRNDLAKFGGTELQRILRRGIQFGPEVTSEEAASGRTQKERGLLFAAYQSNIANGFAFIQKSWANDPTFPPGKTEKLAGFDPIIGVAPAGTERSLKGTDPKAQAEKLTLTAEWVLGRGGEYFFSPSISTLKNKFAIADVKTGL